MVGSVSNSFTEAVEVDSVCVLASDSPCPSIWTYSHRRGEINAHSHLVPSDVPCVLSISHNGREWAAGTHSGILYLGEVQCPDDCETDVAMRWRVVGEPVLDVCHLFAATWATSDTSGRVLVWTPNADPILLPNAGGQIQALASTGDHHVVGITADGRFVIWDVPAHRVVESIQGPPPTTIHQRSFLARWLDAGAWVWPVEGGGLAVLNESTRQVSTLQIHHGSVLAAFAIDGALCTVGKNDRHIRIWRSIDPKPFREFEIDADPVRLALVGIEPLRLVIITEDGGASLWGLEPHGAHRITTIEGDSYCVLAAPNWETHVSNEKVRRQTRAQILAEQIHSLASDSEATTNSLHGELVSIGFRHVSLALKAERQRTQGDVAGELSLLHQLIQETSNDEVCGGDVLVRHRELLERTGLAHALEEQSGAQFEEATDASRTCSDAPNATFSTAVLVVEPEVSIDVVLRAAYAMNLNLRHRFFLRRLGAVQIEHDGATPEYLLKRLDVRPLGGRSTPESVPRLERVSWNRMCHHELISLITIAAHGELAGLQMGIRHSHTEGTQFYELVILLAPMSRSTPARNEAANDFFGLPKKAALRWMHRTSQTFKRELRGLLTEFTNRRRR